MAAVTVNYCRRQTILLNCAADIIVLANVAVKTNAGGSECEWKPEAINVNVKVEEAGARKRTNSKWLASKAELAKVAWRRRLSDRSGPE